MADRYTYVPLIGLFIFLVWGATDLMRGWRYGKTALAALVAVLLVACLVRTRNQVPYWHDGVALWSHTLSVTADNALAENHLGATLAREGRVEEGIPHLRAALRLRPGFADAHNHLGAALAQQGKLEEAVPHFQAALEKKPLSPEMHYNLGVALFRLGSLEGADYHLSVALRNKVDHLDARYNLGLVLKAQGRLREAESHLFRVVQTSPNRADAHHGLGSVLAVQERWEPAARSLSEARRLDPGLAEAHHDLGVVLEASGRPEEALPCYEEAVRLRPEQARYRYNLAFALMEKGQAGLARNHYRESLRLDPNWPNVANRNAWLLATHENPASRNGTAALQLARRACQATAWQKPEYLDTLAAAHAEVGRFSEAIEMARKALTLLADGRHPDLTRQIQARLRLYEKEQPFRDVPDGAKP